MTISDAGRLAKSTQQVVLLDGRQLGTLCHLAALRLPRTASKAAPDDAARQLFFQVSFFSQLHPKDLSGMCFGRVHPSH